MKKFLILCLFSLSAVGAVQIGKPVPSFKLMDANNKTVSLKDFEGKYVVLEWFNKDCPFVRKHYDSKNMQALQEKYTKKNVVWLSIVSSAPEKQGHLSPKEAVTVMNQEGMKATHLLIDENGKTGKSFGAKTTPHMYIVNPKGELAYQGAIDSIPSTQTDDVKKAKNFISANLDNLLAGKTVITPETKAYGCSVKY